LAEGHDKYACYNKKKFFRLRLSHRLISSNSLRAIGKVIKYAKLSNMQNISQ